MEALFTMQRFTAILLLICLCILPMLALAEAEMPAGLPEQPETSAALPQGMWMLTDSGWLYTITADAPLTAAQQETAIAHDLAGQEGYLPSGTLLTSEAIALLYPDNAATPEVAPAAPALTMFELTGTWYYDETGTLVYRHSDSSTVMTKDEVFAILNGTETPPTTGEEKIFYLTIDDAPSKYTMEMLATLQRLDIKATFFVNGSYVRQYPVFMQAIYDAGHGIANHSYSHDKALLNSSFKACLNDFVRCEEAVAEVLGFPLAMPILRIPYGAGSIPVGFRTQLQQHGYLWIDWNALNGDTEAGVKSDTDALERAFSTAGRYDGSIVMLVHDGKKRTIRTMEEMVKHFKDQGYEFRVLDMDVADIPGVRMGFPR